MSTSFGESQTPSTNDTLEARMEAMLNQRLQTYEQRISQQEAEISHLRATLASTPTVVSNPLVTATQVGKPRSTSRRNAIKALAMAGMGAAALGTALTTATIETAYAQTGPSSDPNGNGILPLGPSSGVLPTSPVTPGTNYKTYWGPAFTPVQSATTFDYATGGGIFRVAGSIGFNNSIILPQGSKLTELEFYVIDNDATNFNFFLVTYDPTNAGGFNTVATTASAGTGTGIRTFSLTIPANTLIDNTKYNYTLIVQFGVNGANHTLYGARVGYTLSAGDLFLLPAPFRVAATTNVGGTNPLLVATGATPGNPPATSSASIQVAGATGSGIPASAKGVTGVLTNVGTSNGGNLRIWAGATVPTAVSLNITGAFAPSIPNLSTSFSSSLDSAGKLNIGYGTGAAGATSGYALDITGYYN